MPTYDYLCEDCGYQFEEFQQMSSDPLTICPSCKGHVRRLISPGNGFLFKGAGFYLTDYRSDRYKKDKKKAESKTDSKSETTTNTSNMTGKV